MSDPTELGPTRMDRQARIDRLSQRQRDSIAFQRERAAERERNTIDLAEYEPMARATDPDTSHQAAEDVSPFLSELQQRILAAYRREGPMSARQVERLPEFRGCAPSTVRKRVCELHRTGRLEECGTETDSGRSPCTVYRVTRG